jgi:hypothetical protein
MPVVDHTHAMKCMVHALRRIKERYGVQLTDRTYYRLCHEAAKLPTLEVLKDGTHLRAVPFWNGREKQVERLAACVDAETNVIKTVLPRYSTDARKHLTEIYKVGK